MKKRSINVSGHATSITLEDEFWDELKSCAAKDSVSLSALVEKIDMERPEKSNLSSAIRVYLLRRLKGHI
ncbi:MAG TPA: aryl-sulfate sulfotransferase [Rhodospirillaceae bacterium]|nr:aryl-sulfate sulfotransferase [Rhodospirillaceae bacterium]